MRGLRPVPRSTAGAAVTGVVLAALGLGCSFGVDVDALSECVDRVCETAADSGPDDASDGARRDGGDADVAPAPCPSGRGPAMVRIATTPTFCIDVSEVTADHYTAFLAATDRPAANVLGRACASRTDFTPRGAWPPAPGRLAAPVTHVDYCDAQAFCVWSGKRLCGARTGGALDVGLTSRPAADAWFAACSAEGTSTYPYGNVYDATRCNGVDQGLGAASAVASLPGCRVGDAGPFDLSGNVWEWTDACEADVDVATDRCFARGGAFNAPAAELTCTSRRASTRGETDPTIGFRCCAP